MESALQFLSQDRLLYVPLIEMLRHGEAEVINSDNDGVALYGNASKSIFVASDSDVFLRSYEGSNGCLVVFGNARPRFFTECTPCYQYVYTGGPLEVAGDFRKLDDGYLDTVYDHYTLRPDDKEEMLTAVVSHMFGAFIGGELAGFAGLHSSGSMGYLEVLPAFRRQGVGQKLERFMINYVLQRGRTPHFHVLQDNYRCIAMQSAFHIDRAAKPVTWYFT